MNPETQRGSTIVEAIVAAAIFAICAAATSKLISGAFQRSGGNAMRTQALYLAADRIELLRTMRYDDLAALGATQSQSVARGGVSYLVSTSIGTNQPAVNMSTIGVVVSWSDHGRDQSQRTDIILTSVER